MSSKRPVTPRSRFAEGSMNDRTSAVPPPQFLGPRAPSPATASLPDVPPRSAHGDAAAALEGRRPRSASISERKGLSGLWEGLREKIWGKRRPVSLDGGAVRAEPVEGGGVERPTREEMLASYHELMAAGFFQSRAIQGTRPGTRPPSRDSQPSRPPSRDFGQAYARPRLETIYSPRRIRPDGTPDAYTPTEADPATPDSRGKKRAHGEDDEEKGQESTVRKLRKTTRSISELHSRLRRAREEAHPPVSYPGFRARRSVSGPNRLAKRTPRPSSSGVDRAGVSEPVGAPVISAPVTAPVRLVPGAFDAMREGGSLRLRRVPADGSLREKADDSRPTSPVEADENWGVTAKMQSENSAPPKMENRDATPSTQSANWTSFDDEGPSERWAPPPRRRGRPKTPLCVVPDANRGIPCVPSIPEHFKLPEGENVFGVPGGLSLSP